MKAFFFANHTGQGLDSSSGRRVVGALDGLEPGAYIVAAKASVGTNVASGYPPPAYPYASGVMTLSFGGATDLSYIGVLPESGQNNENAALMVAAETSSTRDARLYFQALYPLRMWVNSVRVAALQLDELHISQEGEDPGDPQQEADDARGAFLRAALLDPELAGRLVKLIRDDPDDD